MSFCFIKKFYILEMLGKMPMKVQFIKKKFNNKIQMHLGNNNKHGMKLYC